MFLEFYKNYKSKDYERYAEEILVENTLGKSVFGSEKATEISANDMESVNGNYMIPSSIYTFVYDASEMVYGERRIKDCVPIVFCMKCSSGKLEGLNFNMIPNDVRASILETIYNSNQKYYNSVLFEGFIGYNINLIKLFSMESGIHSFLKVLKNETGIDVSYAYRSYDISKAFNVRLVECDVWKYIPFLCFKNSLRGADLADLQKMMVETSDR